MYLNNKRLTVFDLAYRAIFIIILLIFTSLIIKSPEPYPTLFLPYKTAKKSDTADITKPYFSNELIPQPAFLASAHSATIETLDNSGSLIALWFAGSHEGKPDVKIWQSEFKNNLWSMAHPVISPQIIIESTKRYVKKVGNPVVYKSVDGHIHLFVVSVAIGGWSGSSINHFISEDNGNTYHALGDLPLSPFFNISTLNRTKAITLSDGGFYLPVYHEFIRTYPELLRFDNKGNFLYEQRLNDFNSLLQPALLALNAKDAYIYMRNSGRNNTTNLYYQQTHNGGNTWSEIKSTNLANHDSSLAVALLDNEQMLMVHNPVKRDKLALAISDDGINYRDIYLLEDTRDKEFSYPSLQVHDGIVDILYTYERKQIKHVRFNLAWLKQQEESRKQQAKAKIEEQMVKAIGKQLKGKANVY